MVNKYCSPQEEGSHTVLHQGGQWVCVYMCVCRHVHSWVLKSIAAATAAAWSSHTTSLCTQWAALPFLMCSTGVVHKKKKLTRLGEMLRLHCSQGLVWRYQSSCSIWSAFWRKRGQTGTQGTKNKWVGGALRGKGTGQGSDHEKTGKQNCILGRWRKMRRRYGLGDKRKKEMDIEDKMKDNAGRVMIPSHSLHNLMRQKKYNQDIKYLHPILHFKYIRLDKAIK